MWLERQEAGHKVALLLLALDLERAADGLAQMRLEKPVSDRCMRMQQDRADAQ